MFYLDSIERLTDGERFPGCLLGWSEKFFFMEPKCNRGGKLRAREVIYHAQYF